MPTHIAIYISNNENKKLLLSKITSGELIPELRSLKGSIFSDITLNHFIEEEERHGKFEVQTTTSNSLKNSSDGEKKRALLNHLLSKPLLDYILLDNVYDCLDRSAQSQVNIRLERLSKQTKVVQIATRKRDILPFINAVYSVYEGKLQLIDDTLKTSKKSKKFFVNELPQPLIQRVSGNNPLIQLRNVSVHYGERAIISNINWVIKPGEFWQLIGPNGSGKSTILSLISGDNPKGYMADMTLFGIKKGSGESVWDIKKNIGFYSSEMLRGFKRRDTIESMIISGFLDSIGLYSYPSDIQINIANQWLALLGMTNIKNKSFSFLSSGHKRLVLIARAMVKHPPLLILDEPTNGLDDRDSYIFAELVNKIASESNTAIIYVSHRKEEHINPDKIFELTPNLTGGSTGQIN